MKCTLVVQILHLVQRGNGDGFFFSFLGYKFALVATFSGLDTVYQDFCDWKNGDTHVFFLLRSMCWFPKMDADDGDGDDGGGEEFHGADIHNDDDDDEQPMLGSSGHEMESKPKTKTAAAQK